MIFSHLELFCLYRWVRDEPTEQMLKISILDQKAHWKPLYYATPAPVMNTLQTNSPVAEDGFNKCDSVIKMGTLKRR